MIKKILITVLMLAIMLTAGFFSLGFIYPKLESVTRVEINKPLAVVWNYFIDERKMGEWMPGFKKMEAISGGPHQVGSQYRMYFDEDSHEVILNETLIAYQPEKLFAFKLENEILNDEVNIEFSYENGKTIIVQKDKICGATPYWRSLFVLTRASMQKQTQQCYDNLKTNIEKLDNGAQAKH